MHDIFMREAVALAREAEAAGEVPVGAVVGGAGEIVGRGRNSAVGLHDPTAHAEMLALRAAAAAIGNYRLEHATAYATLEPCAMCAGALVAARVERLVFGARDLRFGGVRSKFRIADSELLNHERRLPPFSTTIYRTLSTMNMLKTITPLLLICSSAFSQVIYDINFNAPGQSANQLVRVGAAPQYVSQIVYGSPMVLPAFGSLLDQPLVLNMAGNAPAFYYDQLRLNLTRLQSPV